MLVGPLLLMLLGSRLAAQASANSLAPLLERPVLALQVTATPTATLPSEVVTPEAIGSSPAFSLTLAALGYNQTTLNSPVDITEYSFRLPDNWLIDKDSQLELDLSYTYNQAEPQNYPGQFGDLTIKLDDQTLEVFSIEAQQLDNYRLTIPLPASAFAPDRLQHLISLEFDAGSLCAVPHKATLIIHPTSTVWLNYTQLPLELDLSRYPRPFYQQTFTPDTLRIVLPAQPSASNLSQALAVTAKLGDLTGNGLVISPTTDLELSQLLTSTSTSLADHLIVVGQPQENQLITMLNRLVELPVILHSRQLPLTIEGPIEVTSGSPLNYTFSFTNTTGRAANLSLFSQLPPATRLTACTPKCVENKADQTIVWPDNRLAPDKSFRVSLTLQATAALTGVVEQTAMVVEQKLGPVNANTLTTPIVTDLPQTERQASMVGSEGYFFVYNNRAVAKDDGIVMEIPSPWNENRAVLIITGLSDEAVTKASQAMSSETGFPGMSGPVALVREILAPTENITTRVTQSELTLTDLGYSDRVIRGQAQQTINYDFNLPYNWQLTEAAAIDLYFNHSQLIDDQNSSLTVLLNRQPASSSLLDDQTADNGHIHIDLTKANVQPGSNRLSIQINLARTEQCIVDVDQGWLVILADSRISLTHTDITGLNFDLDYFPTPFSADPTLSNLLFVLPGAPEVTEWGQALRLAASLGSAVSGKMLSPMAALGEIPPASEMSRYHIIALGRSSRNPLLQEVNATLPQPFLPGSDEIEQRLDNVIFRLPPGLSLGYLQLIPSPWNPERAFLAVTGTTDEGMVQANATLAERPWVVKGNLVLIRDKNVSTLDTRELTQPVAAAVVTVMSEAAPVVTVTLTATPLPAATPTPSTSSTPTAGSVSTGSSTPGWLFPLVGVNGLLVIAIFAFVFWQARYKRV
ncbi:MAG: cellulose biosynthesis cyclic di-GMP-binding regulatory protein BcsB [Anaerolineales bacterium]|nr:cellulose biosynthesis cyclic di-GMP-binding regulatory protein BcsB [Anaerolineales bacterium]